MTCGWQDIRWMPRGERAFGGGCVLSVSHPTSMCVCVRVMPLLTSVFLIYINQMTSGPLGVLIHFLGRSRL